MFSKSMRSGAESFQAWFRLGLLVAAGASTSSCSEMATAASASNCSSSYSAAATPTLLNRRLATGTRPLCFGAFALLHSGITRTPLYVAERLTRETVEAARRREIRDDRFHPELRLPSMERAELADYRGSGFDRGHMAPSGDMGSPENDHDSFSLANVVPQTGALNRNGWADLETYVRDLAGTLGETYVVTGPAFVSGSVRRINGRVLVPSHIWKAIRVPGQGAGAWIATNDDHPRWEIVSIATLTARIGIDPFPRLDAAAKAQVPAFPTFDN